MRLRTKRSRLTVIDVSQRRNSPLTQTVFTKTLMSNRKLQLFDNSIYLLNRLSLTFELELGILAKSCLTSLESYKKRNTESLLQLLKTIPALYTKYSVV